MLLFHLAILFLGNKRDNDYYYYCYSNFSHFPKYSKKADHIGKITVKTTFGSGGFHDDCLFIIREMPRF